MLKIRRSIHPGETLLEEFMIPLGLTTLDLARKTGLSEESILEIVTERASINFDIASRLALEFGSTSCFWVNLQNRFEQSKENENG